MKNVMTGAKKIVYKIGTPVDKLARLLLTKNRTGCCCSTVKALIINCSFFRFFVDCFEQVLCNCNNFLPPLLAVVYRNFDEICRRNAEMGSHVAKCCQK